MSTIATISTHVDETGRVDFLMTLPATFDFGDETAIDAVYEELDAALAAA